MRSRRSAGGPHRRAIEDALLEEKALEAPVQEETEVVSAGEESEAEDDTDKTKE